MKKIWIYKRKGIKGWWVGYYERGKHKAEALSSKGLAEHYKQTSIHNCILMFIYFLKAFVAFKDSEFGLFKA